MKLAKRYVNLIISKLVLKFQMGEKWKKMTDKDKKPYFEMARKFALEHKQVCKIF